MRPSFLAGTWYPATRAACQADIERHAADLRLEQGAWRGAVVPHAGWRYSGHAMVHTLATLAAARPETELIVVFGSHRGPEGPDTIFCAEAWDTPLGPFKVPQALAEGLRARLHLKEEPVSPRHADNGVEVLLPMMRHLWPHAELLMLGIPAAPRALTMGSEVADACRRAGRQPVFVGSTDLTHYGPRYDFLPHGNAAAAVQWVRDVNDVGFIDAIQRGDPLGALQHGCVERSACCPGAAAAALSAAQRFGSIGRVHQVEHTLSYDVAPDENYVGYAGLLF